MQRRAVAEGGGVSLWVVHSCLLAPARFDAYRRHSLRPIQGELEEMSSAWPREKRRTGRNGGRKWEGRRVTWTKGTKRQTGAGSRRLSLEERRRSEVALPPDKGDLVPLSGCSRRRRGREQGQYTVPCQRERGTWIASRALGHWDTGTSALGHCSTAGCGRNKQGDAAT